jgi:transcriptional regulator of acetoin/glycerol metabolism
MAPALQAKLLRLLETRTFRRIGGSRDIGANVRVLAATTWKLETQVKAGHFREGETIGIVGFGLAGLLLALVPFLDRGTRGRLVTSAALLAIAYILTLTALGYLANPTT